jgi:hypothetical protein
MSGGTKIIAGPMSQGDIHRENTGGWIGSELFQL